MLADTCFNVSSTLGLHVDVLDFGLQLLSEITREVV